MRIASYHSPRCALMMGMKLALALVLAAALTACGGGGGSGYSSARDVATAGGCDSPSDVANADLEFFVTNAVECQVNGHSVTINWFKNGDAFKSYRKTADSFGGAGLAYGDDWAVECHDDQADCDAFVKAVK